MPIRMAGSKAQMTLRSPLRYSLTVQLAAVAVLTLLTLPFGKVAALSTMLGALVYVLPNLYFTHYAFRFRGAERAMWIRQSFLWGEMGKLSLTAVGFALIFRFMEPVSLYFLFAAFVLMIVLQWWLAQRLANALATAE